MIIQNKKLMMKSLIALWAVILTVHSLSAQNLPGGVAPEEVTEEVDGAKKPGGMIALGLKADNLLDEWGLELGVDVIAKLDEHFGIGLSMYYLLTHNLKAPSQNGLARPHIQLYDFGVDLSYSRPISKSVSISLTSMFALGQLNVNDRPDVDVSNSASYEWFVFVEPSLNLNYMFSRSFGIVVGAGYRLSDGVGRFGLKSADMSGTILKITTCTAF